ncbi:UPF0187-domain-containing protein [Tilletiaria anomala UBC 951]|uniref:UPF0187-domain-containing protein n=1 Tax=Tilletiaria anomala (strain ATCC 24038 / CBS 436.72 / UBC 951) TaxID=1037660 RepID=A0A066WBI8_TILAU|nr:UPF0187-domain-containing protein [Tilletiaria anomala UBC 951]KDN48444.1 UPF0187-domain-containing protein [Tilletiaria anomala UBC 951]
MVQGLALSSPLNALQDLSDLDAYRLFRHEVEKSENKLRLSKTRFFLDAIRIRGSVLHRIWVSVLGITLYATVIAAADVWYGMHWRTSNSIIAPLSVVVGLLIVFRNSTSYDRWWAGSGELNAAMADTRSLSRFIWVNVDVEAGEKMKKLKQDAEKSGIDAGATHAVEKLRQERMARKRRVIRLLVCYLYATKHHLRQEYGVEFADYEGVLPQDVRQAYYVLQRRSREHFRRSIHSKQADARPASQASAAVERDNYTPITSVIFQDENAAVAAAAAQATETTPLTASEVEEEKEHSKQPAIALPLFCLHQITMYLSGARRAGLLTNDAGPAGFSLSNQLINSLTTHFFNMQRIADTPLPAIYGIHLKQCVLLYLLALPLTLVSELSWRMIPVVTIVAFTMIGTEGLSSEVEMPFGHDPSDHNLDLLAATVRHELEHMMLFLDEGIKEES